MITPRRQRARRWLGRSDRQAASGQRFGRVTDRQPAASGPAGWLGTYVVCDEQTGRPYAFTDADIVTEGFPTARTGERVRFLTDPADPSRAIYVIRLDLPDTEDYYK